MFRFCFAKLLFLFACTVGALVANPARAQADDATRAAARSLGYEGIGDFQAGNFAAAADKLDRAYQALRVPSLGLWSARALEKTGKLVAAAERYLEVQRLDPGTGDVAVQKQAQADAATEHTALVPRIPNVVIEIEGAPANEVEVSANGMSVPSSLIGVKRPVDPGTVTLEARHGERAAREQVTLAEGETKGVVLRLAPAAAPAPVPVVPVAAATAVPPPPTKEDRPAEKGSSGSGTRTVGFVAIGVGAAGIVAGSVAGGLAMAGRDSIDGCDGTRCPVSEREDVGTYNDLRTISSVCFIAGGVVAATGIVLVIAAPKSSNPKAARRGPSLSIAPWVGAGTAGLFFEARR
jgi:hypothetical protein